MRVVCASLMAAIGAILAVAGCIESSVIVCDDGTTCPADKVCNVTGPGCVDPDGLVVPEGVFSIPSASCGATATISIPIGNPSDAPIAFDARSTIDLVSLDPTSGVVEPGGSVELQVTADATADTLPVGTIEGAISITTDDQMIPRILQVTITGAVVRLSEQGIDFGIASLSAPPDPRTFTIFNDGNAAIDVMLGAPDDPFAISESEPFRIEGGQSRDVDVSFAPIFTGQHDSSIGMSLAGAVCQMPPLSLALSALIDDAPLLIDTTLLDYGTSTCGVPASALSFTITNNLPQPQALSLEVTGDDPLDYTAGVSTVVDPAGQAIISVTRDAIAAPQANGQRSAELQVTASPSNETLLVTLTHEIQAPRISGPLTVNLGVMPQNSLTSQMFTVLNSGSVPATVSATPQPQDLPGGGLLLTSPTTLPVPAMSERSWTVAVASGDISFISEGLFLLLDAPGQCAPPTTMMIEVAVQ